MSLHNLQFAFFGGEPLGVPVLEALAKAQLLPALIVCNPDRPSGRGKQLTPPPVKIWAEEHGVTVWQPEQLHDKETVAEKLQPYDLFIVVAFNHILPKWLIELPQYDTLNLHPSLLPKYRGPSPIRSAILADDQMLGISVMLMDEKMDHGPLLAQQAVVSPSMWPPYGTELDRHLAVVGGALLASVIPAWIEGNLQAVPQEHADATYTKKFTKAKGELFIDPLSLPTGLIAYDALLKIRAFAGFPGTFFIYHGKRVKITAATIENDALVIERVIPEDKAEQSFSQYVQSLSK